MEDSIYLISTIVFAIGFILGFGFCYYQLVVKKPPIEQQQEES